MELTVRTSKLLGLQQIDIPEDAPVPQNLNGSIQSYSVGLRLKAKRIFGFQEFLLAIFSP
jgi:hypothetical protein